MCSYNAINGVPACAEPRLLNGVLRNASGFSGFVVSDYDAWSDIKESYHVCDTLECAAAAGLNAGMEMEGGGGRVVAAIPNAVSQGLVSQAIRGRGSFLVAPLRSDEHCAWILQDLFSKTSCL